MGGLASIGFEAGEKKAAIEPSGRFMVLLTGNGAPVLGCTANFFMPGLAHCEFLNTSRQATANFHCESQRS